MTEPVLLGVPLSMLLIYFLWYSFLGWAIETTYCSLKARRFVYRGFLAGPVCPIYGAGALMMILFFRPLLGHPVVLYLTACVVMSAWEYLVGWLLEVTTHVKYWDYSHLPWNLHGRICLTVSMWWGVLAFFAIHVLHPATQQLFSGLVPPLRWWVAGLLAGVLLADTVTTVRKLAVTTRLMELAEQAKAEMAAKQQELRNQLAETAKLKTHFTEQDWQELLQQASERAASLTSQVREELSARQQERQLARRQLAETARLKAALAAMELRHSALVEQATRQSRRFRRSYQQMSTARYQDTLNRIRERAAQHRAKRRQKKD